MHTNLMSSAGFEVTFNKSVIFKSFDDFKLGYGRLTICHYCHFFAISFVPADCAFNDSRIVILVDSEADQLKQFNDGQEIYDGVKLPSNARFVYATANKKDTMLNWAIIQCDKAASRLLTEYMNK